MQGLILIEITDFTKHESVKILIIILAMVNSWYNHAIFCVSHLCAFITIFFQNYCNGMPQLEKIKYISNHISNILLWAYLFGALHVLEKRCILQKMIRTTVWNMKQYFFPFLFFLTRMDSQPTNSFVYPLGASFFITEILPHYWIGTPQLKESTLNRIISKNSIDILQRRTNGILLGYHILKVYHCRGLYVLDKKCSLQKTI